MQKVVGLLVKTLVDQHASRLPKKPQCRDFVIRIECGSEDDIQMGRCWILELRGLTGYNQHGYTLARLQCGPLH